MMPKWKRPPFWTYFRPADENFGAIVPIILTESGATVFNVESPSLAAAELRIPYVSRDEVSVGQSHLLEQAWKVNPNRKAGF